MRIIELDASGWLDDDDLYDALLPALEAPAWHGRNLDALIDSMGTGSINGIEPPYTISVRGIRPGVTGFAPFFRRLARYLDECTQRHLEKYSERREIHIVIEDE